MGCRSFVELPKLRCAVEASATGRRVGGEKLEACGIRGGAGRSCRGLAIGREVRARAGAVRVAPLRRSRRLAEEAVQSRLVEPAAQEGRALEKEAEGRLGPETPADIVDARREPEAEGLDGGEGGQSDQERGEERRQGGHKRLPFCICMPSRRWRPESGTFPGSGGCGPPPDLPRVRGRKKAPCEISCRRSSRPIRSPPPQLLPALPPGENASPPNDCAPAPSPPPCPGNRFSSPPPRSSLPPRRIFVLPFSGRALTSHSPKRGKRGTRRKVRGSDVGTRGRSLGTGGRSRPPRSRRQKIRG